MGCLQCLMCILERFFSKILIPLLISMATSSAAKVKIKMSHMTHIYRIKTKPCYARCCTPCPCLLELKGPKRTAISLESRINQKTCLLVRRESDRESVPWPTKKDRFVNSSNQVLQIDIIKADLNL